MCLQVDHSAPAQMKRHTVSESRALLQRYGTSAITANRHNDQRYQHCDGIEALRACSLGFPRSSARFADAAFADPQRQCKITAVTSAPSAMSYHTYQRTAVLNNNVFAEAIAV